MKKLVFIAFLIAATLTPARADKAGFYASAGVSANVFRSQNDFVESVFEDELSAGWRLGGGYIWDLGKPGGFQLGVEGLYSDVGRMITDLVGAEVKVQSFSALFVIEQEVARWLDFVGKAGMGAANYDYNDDLGLDISSTEPSFSAALGFVFFPTDYLGIELLAEMVSFDYEYRGCDYYGCYSPADYCYTLGGWGTDTEEICEEGHDDYQSYTIVSLSASLQYRF